MKAIWRIFNLYSKNQMNTLQKYLNFRSIAVLWLYTLYLPAVNDEFGNVINSRSSSLFYMANYNNP